MWISVAEFPYNKHGSKTPVLFQSSLNMCNARKSGTFTTDIFPFKHLGSFCTRVLSKLRIRSKGMSA